MQDFMLSFLFAACAEYANHGGKNHSECAYMRDDLWFAIKDGTPCQTAYVFVDEPMSNDAWNALNSRKIGYTIWM